MKIEVHILSHDEEQFLEWSLRHYRTFASRICVWDGGPMLIKKAMVERYGAEHFFWDTAGELNDELARTLKNNCWLGTDADWVIVVDADEILYFPNGVLETLLTYERLGAVAPKPQGFEMFADWWPEIDWIDEVSGYVMRREGQIYDYVKDGAPDDKWYSKPVLFSPKRVADSGIGIGGHESRPILKDGRSIYVSTAWPKANPPCLLLHYHQVGPAERVASRYDATRKRLSSINVERRYGNFKPGMEHCLEKRAQIIPNLRRVIP